MGDLTRQVWRARNDEAARIAAAHARCDVDADVENAVWAVLPTSKRGLRLWEVQSRLPDVDVRTMTCVLWRLVGSGRAYVRGGYDRWPHEWVGVARRTADGGYDGGQETLWR